MENWTLGDINAFLVFIITFIGTLGGVYLLIKKFADLLIKPVNVKLETLSIDMNNKIDDLQSSIDDKLYKVDKNATMNYLVRCFEDLDKGNSLDGVARQRFLEQYSHYITPVSEGGLGGNSYIKEEYERLKKDGKL